MEISTLSPAELGLPEKFGEFRPQQLMALERIARSDKKVILLQAPTGSGKTGDNYWDRKRSWQRYSRPICEKCG